MSAPKITPQKCTEGGCENTYMPHHWGAKKAQREGWFIQKNGDAFCADHTPAWVEAWRKKKAKAKK